MTDFVEPTDSDGFVVRRVDSGVEVLLKLIGELDLAGCGLDGDRHGSSDAGSEAEADQALDHRGSGERRER